jgi:hypothetical protein
MPPQPSGGVPHVAFRAVQVVGVHPQMFMMPPSGPPPHVSGGVHVPQLTMPPQPSEKVLQFLISHSVALGIELQQTFGVSPCDGMPPHVAPASQVPHWMIVWQVFVCVPHAWPPWHVVKFGVHPQTFGVPPSAPPPHVSGARQLFGSQVIGVPQLLLSVPQLSAGGQLVKLGVQPHTLAIPPPPQVSGVMHVPQLTVPPQPSETIPHVFPVAVQSVATVPGVQQTFGVSPCVGFPPQVCPPVHAGPQLIVVLQLFVSVPQFAPAGHVVTFGLHPHSLAVPPPPQVFGAVQVPQ